MKTTVSPARREKIESTECIGVQIITRERRCDKHVSRSFTTLSHAETRWVSSATPEEFIDNLVFNFHVQCFADSIEVFSELNLHSDASVCA